MSRLTVMTVVGTRPEIIRLSRLIPRLDQVCHHLLVHTGQNYDPELSDVFFRDLGVRPPDAYLGIGSESLATAIAGVLVGTERLIVQWRPDAVLILGDTNSSLAAIVARRMKVPVFHMEAGNRSFDRNVPEETNRKIVDHISDINLVYSEHARRNLIREGVDPRRVYLSGSPMREVLDHASEGIARSAVLDALGLVAGGYYVASLHREENVDHPKRLRSLLRALEELAVRGGVPVILSTHPRTRRRIEEGRVTLSSAGLRLVRPLGYFDYLRLQLDARCTVSDSGSVSEEAAILGFPAVTPRDAIERPEAMDTGSVLVTGTDAEAVLDGVAYAEEAHARALAVGATRSIPPEYLVTDFAHRVTTLVLGLARLSNAWDGIRAWDPESD